MTKGLFFVAMAGGLAAVGAYAVLWPVKLPEGRVRAGLREAQPVLVAQAAAGNVPVYLEGLGTVRALNTVTVQPQVDGRLMSVEFREGQHVKRGEVLAQIDPTLYQASLDQAKARQAQNEAQLANARLDLDRKVKSRLASSQQQVDTAKALVAQLEALVKADQANVANATAQLGYTRIVAPISGRTGIRMVDQGNVVRGNATSAVVMITQVQPISVLFNLPQQQLGRINKAMAVRSLSVEAMEADGTSLLDAGTLQVVDNQVDQATGTIRLKAEFPNQSLQLWPGQFVNVRLLIDKLQQVVVVPTSAVQQGPTGSFVFVVEPNGETVKIRPVTTGQRDDRQSVIEIGLKVAERVVISGFARLRDGSKVSITDADSEGKARPPGRNGKRGRGTGSAAKDGSAEGPTP